MGRDDFLQQGSVCNESESDLCPKVRKGWEADIERINTRASDLTADTSGKAPAPPTGRRWQNSDHAIAGSTAVAIVDSDAVMASNITKARHVGRAQLTWHIVVSSF